MRHLRDPQVIKPKSIIRHYSLVSRVLRKTDQVTPRCPTDHMLHRPVAARLGRLCTHSILHTLSGKSVTATRHSATVSRTADAGMDLQLEQLVRDIHASPFKAVIYVTGGCAQVVKVGGFHRIHLLEHNRSPTAAVSAQRLPQASQVSTGLLCACLPCRVPPGCCQCRVPHPPCWRWLCHTAGAAWWSCWGRCEHTRRNRDRRCSNSCSSACLRW